MKKDHLDEIIDAAAFLFITKGFQLTKIKDIAEKAEIATGSIYKYFQSKEDIWITIPIALLDEERKDLLVSQYPINFSDISKQHQVIIEKFQQIDQLMEREILGENIELASIIELLVRLMDKYGKFFLLIEKNQKVDEKMTDYYQLYRKKLFSYVHQFFAKQIDNAVFRKIEHLDCHVELVIDSISRLTIHKKYDSFEIEEIDKSLVVAVLVDTFEHAYLVRE